MGENMYPKTPDLAAPAAQGLSDGELFYIIQNGVRWTGMPSWKAEHSAEDTWRLVSFIRAVPKLTPSDLESVGLASAVDEVDHHHDTDAEIRPDPSGTSRPPRLAATRSTGPQR